MAVDCLLWRCVSAGWFLNCGICGGIVLPEQDIQFDHIHADVFDGPHEYKNLRPVHAKCHKKKTAQDIKDNSKIKRLLNPKPSKRPMKSSGKKIPSRPFQKRRSSASS